MQDKPLLYIDVDGVLFGLYGGFSQLRPNVVQFLRWCTEHFECRWLTAWPKGQLDTLFGCLMAADIAKQIAEATRNYGPYGKAGDIDYSRDFYWIEDGLFDPERTYLAARGMLDRYIAVNPEGCDELERVWDVLRGKVQDG